MGLNSIQAFTHTARPCALNWHKFVSVSSPETAAIANLNLTFQQGPASSWLVGQNKPIPG
jgi:hypothetical protein